MKAPPVQSRIRGRQLRPKPGSTSSHLPSTRAHTRTRPGKASLSPAAGCLLLQLDPAIVVSCVAKTRRSQQDPPRVGQSAPGRPRHLAPQCNSAWPPCSPATGGAQKAGSQAEPSTLGPPKGRPQAPRVADSLRACRPAKHSATHTRAKRHRPCHGPTRPPMATAAGGEKRPPPITLVPGASGAPLGRQTTQRAFSAKQHSAPPK
ncbi:hypothetical protein NDU88_002959 [Pleurodeles waltl]|uniref:Uncharacterized protein n=1 Tax=Pleurodeles waltl TaxID=8319 RepID=A0AAV7LH83_PLEWA|nr:hypothetical protein NDU88_002959 [Pleurodeles waltl]